MCDVFFSYNTILISLKVYLEFYLLDIPPFVQDIFQGLLSTRTIYIALLILVIGATYMYRYVKGLH